MLITTCKAQFGDSSNFSESIGDISMEELIMDQERN